MNDKEHIFDASQREVIGIDSGSHLVLAPPGCGKTDLLTERVVVAHERGVDYGDMLCLTFTNRAAKGMANRIADRTCNPVPDKLFVGNIHRFCSQLLFEHGVVGAGTGIIDEHDADNIIQEELSPRLGIRSRTTELLRYQHALWQLQLGMRGKTVLHSDLLQVGAIHKLCDVLHTSSDEDGIASIYSNIEHFVSHHSLLNDYPAAGTFQLAQAYQQYKEAYNLVDYDDLLVLAWQQLGLHPDWHRYSWIEVDEVQDLNPLQLELVQLLATPDATVVYLGDEQQAIFSFIGAKLETLQTLKQQHAGHIHRLHTNYRSPRYLLDLQNDYATRNLHLPADAMPTTADQSHAEPMDLCIVDVGEAQTEAYYAVRLAQRYGQLDPDGRVALLVSTNRDADDLGDQMTAMGIGHFKISGTDLFSQPAVRLLTAHLSVLADETVFIAWARLLWGMQVVGSYTSARELLRQMRSHAMLPTDVLRPSGKTYLHEMVEMFETEEFVIFDTETTGLDTDQDDIVQIAAIRVRGGKVVGRPFEVLLETNRELPPIVGGATNPMLEVYAHGPRLSRERGLRQFMNFARGATLVGHNVEYDYRILRANLQRSCPDLPLETICPRYYDTLKYIRLVRPRLRSYKLAHLLDVLHLTGQNSHRATDDIMATLSLLVYCHQTARTLLGEQQIFIELHKAKWERLRQHYTPLYQHACQHMDVVGEGVVSELQYAYQTLVEQKHIAPIDKWQHLTHYLQADLIRTDLYPTLRKQLHRYVGDLNTTKEADLCGGSLQEKFVISTVHKAKGLEFETVIVYRAIDGVYPGVYSLTERQIDEDARKLFVAISRSRRRLMVITDSYFRQSVHHLSPFLEKVQSHFTRYHRTPEGKIREG